MFHISLQEDNTARLSFQKPFLSQKSVHARRNIASYTISQKWKLGRATASPAPSILLQTLIELAQGGNVYKYIKRGVGELMGAYTPSQAKRAVSDMERRITTTEQKLNLLEKILEESNPELLRTIRVLEADGDVPSVKDIMDFHRAIHRRENQSCLHR